MKRLQFRNDSTVFQNREEALAFFANIANPEMGISDRFGDSLYAEPMVVKYLDENNVEQVILAIGKDSGKTPYHLIDSAQFVENIAELGEKDTEIEGMVTQLSGAVVDGAVRVEKYDQELDANVREEYVIRDNNGDLGPHIKIYKDSALVDVQLGKRGATGVTKVDDTYVLNGTFEGNDDAILYFVYLTENGELKLVGIDFEKYVLEAEAGDGLYINDNHVMSVRIDETNDEGFLRVGENGLSTSGIGNAIINAIDQIASGISGDINAAKVYSKDILVERTLSGTNLTIQVDGKTIKKEFNYPNDIATLTSPITLRDITDTNTDTTIKSVYALFNGDGERIGDEIKIYNEGHLKNVILGRTDTRIDPVTGNIISDGVGEKAMVFIYATSNGYQMASVAIEDLVPAKTFTEIYEKIDRDVSSAITISKAYTDQRVEDLTSAIGSLTDTINTSVDAMTDLIDTKITQEGADRLAADTALSNRIDALSSTYETKDNVSAKISSAVTNITSLIAETSAATLSNANDYADQKVADAVAEINGTKVVDVVYDKDINSPKYIQLRLADGTLTDGFDASDFLVDGILTSVDFDGENLIFIWNNDANTKIEIPISSLSDIYEVASGSVSYLKIDGKEVSAIVDKEGGYARTLATTDYVDNAAQTAKTDAITESEAYTDNKVNALSGNVENAINAMEVDHSAKLASLSGAVITLNGDESVQGSVLHMIDDKFAKDLITGGLPATEVTLEDAKKHSLLRVINVGGEDRYYVPDLATEMYYVPVSGSPVNLNEYITNLQNRIAELEAENAALDERVTILENASIDEEAVKNIIKGYLEGTNREIKIGEVNDKLRIGFADDAIFGEYIASS